ncbi:MAG: hypothetical protein RLY86_3999 [Pseudomonadota bacterium]|jgi:predicted O-linked N-acetylglucosamine transferase (SPINDLY family)
MTFADLFAAVASLTRAGDAQAVIGLYRTWIAANPADPAVHAAHFNLGVLLSDQADLQGALLAFNEAIRVKPDFAPAHINLGSVLERMGQKELAISYWNNVSVLLGAVTGDAIAYRCTALKQTARVLEQDHHQARAEEVLRQSLDLRPGQRDILQHWISLRQRQCKWPVLEPLPNIPVATMVSELAPLSAAIMTDDPILHLGIAHHHNKEDVPRPARFRTDADFQGRRRGADGRLKIGYLSSDLRAHAIGYLTCEMFGLHDRSRVEVTAFFCGFPMEDSTKARIRADVDHWVDINGLSDDDAAEEIFRRGIDILIDVNGNTRDARTAVLARRPAPINVNWLGFPGSMGSPYHHYIIADGVIIPPGSETYYTEKVVRLPCYQPNNRGRRIAERTPTRAEMGLPDDAMVYCSFNGPQKLTPFTFDRWMEILRAVDGSVLWMLRPGAEAEARLMARAEAQGVSPDRLIMANPLPNAEHLARYVLADLFLDSSPYGAHTTASDAMWMGVPVLTVPGRSFASRVCASLISAGGLGDFVCADPQEYVERAIALGRDRAGLAAVRQRLLDLRDRSVLFDTPGFARAMEDAFDEMWRDWEAGTLPRPDVTNLELYRELGGALDHERTEMATVGDYEDRYRRLLAERHRFSPVPADTRLWTPDDIARYGDAPLTAPRSAE